MNVNPVFLAIRAVSADFAQRIYLPVVLVVASILIVLIGVSIWLVTLNGWWWILLGLLIFLSLVFGVVALIGWLLIHVLKPAQNKRQRKEVHAFVDTLQKSSETLQTPKFILIFRLVRDVVFPRQNSFIKEITASTASLKGGFESIVASFRNA